MIPTFLEILEEQRIAAFRELKNSIIKNRVFERSKLLGDKVPAQIQNMDGHNRAGIKGLKETIKMLDSFIQAEKDSPSDSTDKDLSLVLD